MKNDLFFALDLGTTNIKAVAFDARGATVAAAIRPAITRVPRPGWSEQDPEAVFTLITRILADLQAAAGPPTALGFSSALHSVLSVDAFGKVLRPARLWSDLRAADPAVAEQLQPHARELYSRTGVPNHPMTPLAKIIWMRLYEPELWKQAHYFLGLKEYVLLRLTGRAITDLAVASGTGLLDLETMHWNPLALELAGITAERLPEIVSPYFVTSLANPIADLPAGLPIIIGAADGCLANLGIGALQPNDAVLTIGTSGAFRHLTPRPMLDVEGRAFCYRMDEQLFVAGGATNNGANALAWLSSILSEPIEQLLPKAATVLPGAEGLFFLPYLQGERAPVWNPAARGVFYGLDNSHGPGHLTRALLEGVIFNLRWIAERLETHTRFDTLFVTGGFTASPLWVQLVSDIFDRPLLVGNPGTDASVLGVLHCMRRALGMSVLPPPTHLKTVQPAGTDSYIDIFKKFKNLYTSLPFSSSE